MVQYGLMDIAMYDPGQRIIWSQLDRLLYGVLSRHETSLLPVQSSEVLPQKHLIREITHIFLKVANSLLSLAARILSFASTPLGSAHNEQHEAQAQRSANSERNDALTTAFV